MTWWQIALIAYLGAMAWMGWAMWRAPEEEDLWNVDEGFTRPPPRRVQTLRVRLRSTGRAAPHISNEEDL